MVSTWSPPPPSTAPNYTPPNNAPWPPTHGHPPSSGMDPRGFPPYPNGPPVVHDTTSWQGHQHPGTAQSLPLFMSPPQGYSPYVPSGATVHPHHQVPTPMSGYNAYPVAHAYSMPQMRTRSELQCEQQQSMAGQNDTFATVASTFHSCSGLPTTYPADMRCEIPVKSLGKYGMSICTFMVCIGKCRPSAGIMEGL